ncbi:MAG: IPTL-CTERM sorting domain-containing protein, partial [Deltaproteobacteria bacterium]
RPDRADTDGDGISDGDEVANGTNPNVAEGSGFVSLVPSLSVWGLVLLCGALASAGLIGGRRRRGDL